MADTLHRRVWVEINLDAIEQNYQKIAHRVAPAQVLCVLKANAYGLGVANYARALASTSCMGFGVAEPFEAKELRHVLNELGSDKKIQILSSILPDEIAPMVEADVTLPLIDEETARLISSAAQAAHRRVRVHVKVDSGMGRLGVRLDDAYTFVHKVWNDPNLICEGIFSHCPLAYDPHNPYTHQQIARFAAFIERLKSEGITFPYVHIAASDAINNFPEAACAPFNLVRAGINLHGSFDPNGRRVLDVEPVLTLKTRVAQVRNLPAGATLGYGRTWCLAESSRIATISAGYADGLPLALSNRGFVLIQGVRCPILGRISMDYTTVNVSAVPSVTPGDEVICFGRSGNESISPDDWAVLKGTHAYDIICSLGSRVARLAVSSAGGQQ